MRHIIFVVFFLTSLASGGSAAAQQWAKKMFKEFRHDFGTIAKGAKAEFEFPFTNGYVQDVRIYSIHASCGCTSVRLKNNKRLLKTHETGTIVASINSSTFIGSKGATITVKFDMPYRAEVQLQVKAYVRSDVMLRPGSAKLGSVQQGTAVEQRIDVSTPRSKDLRILEVRSSNPHLSGQIVETGGTRYYTQYQLRVRLDKDAPAGYVHNHLMLVTNDRRRSQVPVLVEGYVHSAISISPHALFMGVVKPGEKVSKNLVVRANEPFVIKKITALGEGFEFDTSAEQAPKELHVIPVTFVAGDEPGKVIRAIQIETNQQEVKGELLAQVMVMGPDGNVPESIIGPEPGRPGTLRPDPSAVAMPGAQRPLALPEDRRLVRPSLDDDLPERPILARFPRLYQRVRERDIQERDARMGQGAPPPVRLRPGEPPPRTFRNESQQRRYQELLRRNGPSPDRIRR